LFAAALLVVFAAPAAAEPAVGVINGANMLVTFDTAVPSLFTSTKPVSGLSSGERLVDVDFRYGPQTTLVPLPPPQLFGVGVVDGATDTVRIYTIDVGTGVATRIPGSTPFAATSGNFYGVDFNPTVDRVRVVNDGDENLRINPNNGARADTPTNDTDVNPAGFLVSGVAYDRVNIPTPLAIASNTTAYGISRLASGLVTIGGINQSPSPNGGALMNSKPLGLTIASGTPATMDIDFSGAAFSTLTPNGGNPGLYSINLATGAATLVGGLPSTLSGFAIEPADSVQFTASSFTQSESGPATIEVSRSGTLAETATVDFSTQDGSATTGDYVPSSGTLTFAPGETTKSFSVPLADDGITEGDETVNLVLSSSSSPMSLGAPAVATLTIANDPAPTFSLKKVASSMKLGAFLKGIKVSIDPSEAASLKGELLGTVKSARVSSYNLSLVSKSLTLGAGKRTLTLKPSKRLVGSPRGKFKVRLRVTATDGAGNSTVVNKTITVSK
jgi:hypothetical protein